MDAETYLEQVYQEWQDLAEIEAEAITERDWSRVAESQPRLRELHNQILYAVEAAQEEWARAGVNAGYRDGAVRSIVDTLIEFQNRNQALLAAHHQEAWSRLHDLERKRRRTNSDRRPAALPT